MKTLLFVYAIGAVQLFAAGHAPTVTAQPKQQAAASDSQADTLKSMDWKQWSSQPQDAFVKRIEAIQRQCVQTDFLAGETTLFLTDLKSPLAKTGDPNQDARDEQAYLEEKRLLGCLKIHALIKEGAFPLGVFSSVVLSSKNAGPFAGASASINVDASVDELRAFFEKMGAPSALAKKFAKFQESSDRILAKTGVRVSPGDQKVPLEGVVLMEQLESATKALAAKDVNTILISSKPDKPYAFDPKTKLLTLSANATPAQVSEAIGSLDALTGAMSEPRVSNLALGLLRESFAPGFDFVPVQDSETSAVKQLREKMQNVPASLKGVRFDNGVKEPQFSLNGKLYLPRSFDQGKALAEITTIPTQVEIEKRKAANDMLHRELEKKLGGTFRLSRRSYKDVPQAGLEEGNKLLAQLAEQGYAVHPQFDSVALVLPTKFGVNRVHQSNKTLRIPVGATLDDALKAQDFDGNKFFVKKP